MKILLIGATGLVGSHVLEKLLKLDTPNLEVSILTRKKVSPEHQALKQYIGDDLLKSLNAAPHLLESDIVISCLGTTIKKVKSKENFIKIDKDLPLSIFKAITNKSKKKAILISALGASADSKIFYNQIKGEIEDELKSMHYEKTVIIRPSLIIGERDESRPLEAISQKLLKHLPKFVPSNLKKYTPHDAELIARSVLDFIQADKTIEPIQFELIK